MVGDSFIEAIYPFDDPVAIVCDEEGKLRNATSGSICGWFESDSVNA